VKDVLSWLVLSVAYGSALYLLGAWADKRRKKMLREYDEELEKINRKHDARLEQIHREHDEAVQTTAKRYGVDLDDWMSVAIEIAREMREAMGRMPPPQKIRIDLDVEQGRPRAMGKAN